MVVKEGDKPETHKGIFKIEGDTLTICVSHPPQERPTEFAATGGGHWPALIVFKRAKGKE
jgi:hypothetical protein